MADDANEDSWLYGTSNPDSTTNEEDRHADSEAIVSGSADNIASSSSSTTAAAGKPTTTEEADSRFGDGQQFNGAGGEQQSPDSHEITKPEAGGDFEEDDPAQEMEEDEEAVATATGESDVADSGNDREGGGSGSGDGDKEPGDSEDDDSDDDDINVVIGDIKSAPSSYNIKQRQPLLAPGAVAGADKAKPTQGKFSIEEFESVGTINGVAAHEFSIDSLDEKPWRKPGADITDYFNYGFNEDTWRSYCERQKKFRLNESGVGLQGLAGPPPNLNPPPMMMNTGNRPLMAMNPDKYGMQRRPMPTMTPQPSKENVIQVMTAECREYSRPGNPMGGGFGPEFFEPDPYDYGYEPTQESQWLGDNPNANPNWVPTGIKELTPNPSMVPPPMGMPMPPMGGPPMGGPRMGPPHGMPMGPPMGPPMMGMGPQRMMPPPHMMNDRERDRDRDRDRDGRDREVRDRDRDRERDPRERDRGERDRDRHRERDYDRTDRPERERGERERDREREHARPEETERTDEDRERRRRERERERERERSSRRERSRSADRTRRRSKSRERERDRKPRDKKKSHRKDKEDSE